MIDMLGHPVKVGMTVLTTGYATSSSNTIAKVEKVNKKSIIVSLYVTRYDWTIRAATREVKPMRRTASQVIVIDQQLAYNEEHFPENLI